nr:hypothetical protein [Tanacetum cinerariifolium]
VICKSPAQTGMAGQLMPSSAGQGINSALPRQGRFLWRLAKFVQYVWSRHRMPVARGCAARAQQRGNAAARAGGGRAGIIGPQYQAVSALRQGAEPGHSAGIFRPYPDYRARQLGGAERPRRRGARHSALAGFAQPARRRIWGRRLRDFGRVADAQELGPAGAARCGTGGLQQRRLHGHHGAAAHLRRPALRGNGRGRGAPVSGAGGRARIIVYAAPGGIAARAVHSGLVAASAGCCLSLGY